MPELHGAIKCQGDIQESRSSRAGTKNMHESAVHALGQPSLRHLAGTLEAMLN